MKKYLLLLIFPLLFVSCGGSSDHTPTPPTPVADIKIDQPEINVSAAAFTQTVVVESNVAWQIVGMNDWVSVEPSTGVAGTTPVKVIIKENADFSQRNLTLTVMQNRTTRASSQVIVIRQTEPGGLIINDKNVTVSRKSSVLEVTLLANVEYTFEADAPWIAPGVTKALLPHKIQFEIQANPTLEQRTGTITFKDKNSALTTEMTVTQLPNGTVMTQNTRSWDAERRGDIFYEIFVRSFADSDGDGIGDLNGITAKLDYLADMGVTGLWLMPINPSPSYHGYDVTDFKAVNPQYGTIQDFENLVAAANAKGIKIVLDFVINHSSNQHPWFVAALANPTGTEGGYYSFVENAKVKQECEAGNVAMVDDNVYNGVWWRGSGAYRYYGMFSDVMPDFNYGRVPNLAPVYSQMLDAAKFWMDKGAAGLRLDAVKHIYQNERGQENIKFLNRFYTDLKSLYPNIYMIGEILSGTDDSKEFLRAIPSVFHFDSWWKLDDALSKSMGRYYAKDMSEAWSKFTSEPVYKSIGTKLSNHDEDRAMSKLGRSEEKAKIAFAAIMATPGQPYIYYGEEIGMWGMKDTGDENVREPILWGDRYTATWRATKAVKTVAEQRADPGSLLNFYLEFTKLRNTYPALAKGVMTFADPAQTPNELMVLTRTYGAEKIMVIANFSDKELEYTVSQTAANLVKAHAGASLLKFVDGTSVADLKPYSLLIIEL